MQFSAISSSSACPHPLGSRLITLCPAPHTTLHAFLTYCNTSHAVSYELVLPIRAQPEHVVVFLPFPGQRLSITSHIESGPHECLPS